MNYKLELTKVALEDIEKHKKSGNKALLKKLEKLLVELTKHPLSGSGKPKALQHDLMGLFSRRIDQKHRLIYSIDQSKFIVIILSAHSHYKEK